jgi:hypothetical protein
MSSQEHVSKYVPLMLQAMPASFCGVAKGRFFVSRPLYVNSEAW